MLIKYNVMSRIAGDDSVDQMLVPGVWEPEFGFPASNEKTL